MDFENKPVRSLAISFAVIGAVLVVGSYVGSAVMISTLPSRIVNKTLDTNNVIQNYEWFKQQYQDILAIDQKIATFKLDIESFEASAGPRDTWKFDDRQEWNRINSVVSGLTSQKASMVAEYNAKSQMANRNLFKTNDLPEQL